jgi:hypothetical protein
LASTGRFSYIKFIEAMVEAIDPQNKQEKTP